LSEHSKDKLSDATVEILEALWTLEEKGSAGIQDIRREAATEVSSALVEALCREELIAHGPHDTVHLLDKGREMAEQIIRRHRLAERLICDVLGSDVDDSEGAACEFEHLLAEGITSSICTLLGHPRYCPHNRPIPEGDCCRQAREDLKPIVVSCDMLSTGESARVAYLATREHSRLLKLAALGISPGVSIRLLQKWPSFVVQCEETEIAVEREVAQNIYVWQNQQ
jgi:DtxR family Mn-dependent transcriptional regulator